MDQNQEALSDRGTEFYQAMGERSTLKARCEHLEEKLLDDGPNTKFCNTTSNDSDGDVGHDDEVYDIRASDDHADGESTNIIDSNDTTIQSNDAVIQSNDTDADEKAIISLVARQTTNNTSKIGIISSSISNNAAIPPATKSNSEDGEEDAGCGDSSCEVGTSSNSSSRRGGSTRSTRS